MLLLSREALEEHPGKESCLKLQKIFPQQSLHPLPHPCASQVSLSCGKLL